MGGSIEQFNNLDGVGQNFRTDRPRFASASYSEEEQKMLKKCCNFRDPNAENRNELIK